MHPRGDFFMKKNKLLSVIFLSVSILFFICFSVVSTLMKNGIIRVAEFSSSIQGILASIIFLPFFISIFFLGQHLKTKAGIWQNIYKVLNFVSIALFCYAVVIIIFSIINLIV